ncbi:MAG: glycosyltransferase family 4 protein, partial [Synergistaceae bacterium]|nr:glycosyltransferase family 4 protein [Synergistaceae bacterium]
EENMSIASDFYAKYPGLSGRVVFTGEIRDRARLLEIYRDAKIFAFPSTWESFGIALAEAMMQGCFAVVSKIPASEYLTEGYRFALGSDVDDVGGLAENLLHACTHEEESERLALEGMRAVRSRLDLKRASEAIERELN